MYLIIYILLFLTSNVYANPWHCLCYDELIDVQVKTVTNCRPTLEECSTLSDKILTGSKQIIANSLKRSCTQINATYPWDVLGGEWQASKKAGSWQYLNGCLLEQTQNDLKAKLLNTELLNLEKDYPSQPLFLISENQHLHVHNFEKIVKSFDFKGEYHYSHDLELLWILNKQRLSVVDFRSDTLVEIPIIDHLPQSTMIQISFRKGFFNIGEGENFLKLNWHKTPAVELDTTNSKVQIVGKKWLEDEHNRPKVYTSNGKDAPKQKYDECESEEICGKAKYFPNTSNIIYISSHSCGDNCYTTCKLIHQETGKIRKLNNCDPYFFSKDQMYYGNANSICDLNHSCLKIKGKVIGALRSELQINP